MESLQGLATGISGKYGSKDIFGGNIPAGTPMQNTEPERTDPRAYSLISGQNIITNPRSEIAGLTPFQILDHLARSTDLIQIAENILINQISGRKWDIIVVNPEDTKNHKDDIAVVEEFFKHPDKERTYSRWIRKALKNITRYDAFCLYKRRDRKGRLYGLSIIDGSTIKLLTDSNGYKPIPPYYAYQQIIYGSVRGQWTLNDLIYAPMSEELKGNYGMSPIERILIGTIKYLKKQNFDYSYFTGSYPDGDLYSLRPNDQSQWSADDILKFQVNWDSEMATAEKRQSLKFVPDGSLQRTKEHTWDTVQEEWFGKLVATSMGINANTFSKQVNRAVADTDDRQQTELGLAPYIRHLEDILTDVIQEDLGFKDLAFKIKDEKLEDDKARVEKNIKYINAGVYSRNEVRKEEGREAIEGGNEYTVQVGNALLPVEKVGQMVTVAPDGANSQVISKDIVQDSSGHIVTSDKMEKAEKKNQLKQKAINNKEQQEENEVKKAVGLYKNFLIQRFKKNKPMYGFINDKIPDVIKGVESNLINVNSISDILDIVKAQRLPDKKLTNKLKNTVSKKFKIVKKNFVKYYEPYYKKGDINAISSFDFKDDEIEAEIVDILADTILLGSEIGETQLEELLTHTPLSIEVHFGEHEAAEKATTYTDKLVKGVDQATINFIQQTVSQAIANEKDWEWLKEQFMDNDYYAFSEKRATCIAKTEEARALNDGAVTVWKESGYVDKVEVIDGDGCEICAGLNGTIQTIEWAENNLLEHPNCVRDFTPLINPDALKNQESNQEDTQSETE